MHQIVCRLGLRPRPPLGELIALPRPPSWFRGGTPGEGEGRGGKRRGGVGGIGTPPPGTGSKGGEGNGGKDGVGG